MNKSLKFNAGSALLAGLLMAGCGGSKDDVSVAPPPAPPAPVTMDAATAASPAVPAPDAAPGGAPPPSGTAAAVPGAQGTESADIFKGMSPRDIEEFKKNATPETHDMNYGPVLEAVNGFKGEFGRYPSTMEELVKARYLPKVLYAPKGKKYSINPQTGEVTVQ